jgi:sRNA-binding carbon storage regulator CsrA
MLVLTRASGERLIFHVRQPDCLPLEAVLCVKIDGPNRVRIEFEGPPQIELWREEVKIKERRNGS